MLKIAQKKNEDYISIRMISRKGASLSNFQMEFSFNNGIDISTNQVEGKDKDICSSSAHFQIFHVSFTNAEHETGT